jgi:hypothetical protein
MEQFQLGNPVWQWWLILSLVSLANIAMWLFARRAAAKEHSGPDNRLQAVMIVLAGIYVFVCAFRSVIPRADVQRISLFDTWAATVFVGRTAATAAELSFVAQWSLALRRVARLAGERTAEVIALSAVPIIALAEGFSWYAVISTNYLGNVIEESLWAATGMLAVVASAMLLPRYLGALQKVLALCLASSLAYCAFMVTHDVPMYLHRWLAAQAGGQAYLPFWEGLRDVATRRVVTYDINDWREEIPWMSFYFSVSVWFSIALCRVQLQPATVRRFLRRPLESRPASALL